MVNAALALSLLLTAAPSQERTIDTLVRLFPFTENSERIAGEFNGLAFLSARGTTPEAPRAALGRLTGVFTTKQSIALVAPGGDAAVFWQALGLQKLSSAQRKQMERVLEDTALQLTAASYRGTFPPLWAHDMLCVLDVLKLPTCEQPDPLALGVAVQRALPNLLWHAVTLTRRHGETHYVWTVWPEVDFGGLFLLSNPEERKALCGRAKFPRAANASCPVIATFSTGETESRIEIIELPAGVPGARATILRELTAAGWFEAEGMAGDFLQFRHPAGNRSLLLLVRPGKKAGSTAIFIENRSGAGQ